MKFAIVGAVVIGDDACGGGERTLPFTKITTTQKYLIYRQNIGHELTKDQIKISEQTINY